MKLKGLQLALIASGAAMAVPAAAHHSFAMFDAAHPMTMIGTVQEFEWVNPHSWLRILVRDEAAGRDVQWALELGSPVQQMRVGWSADSLAPGDQVTVTIHPLKDGSRAGGLISATLPDGSVLGNGGLRPNAQRSSKFPGGLPAGVFGTGDEQPTPEGD